MVPRQEGEEFIINGNVPRLLCWLHNRVADEKSSEIRWVSHAHVAARLGATNITLLVSKFTGMRLIKSLSLLPLFRRLCSSVTNSDVKLKTGGLYSWRTEEPPLNRQLLQQLLSSHTLPAVSESMMHTYATHSVLPCLSGRVSLLSCQITCVTTVGFKFLILTDLIVTVATIAKCIFHAAAASSRVSSWWATWVCSLLKQPGKNKNNYLQLFIQQRLM